MTYVIATTSFTDNRQSKRSLNIIMKFALLFYMQPHILKKIFRRRKSVWDIGLPQSNYSYLLDSRLSHAYFHPPSENFLETFTSFEESLAHQLHNFRICIFFDRTGWILLMLAATSALLLVMLEIWISWLHFSTLLLGCNSDTELNFHPNY